MEGTRRSIALRHQAPVPAERVPPFVLLRQVDGDVLIAPFPRDGLSSEAAVLVSMASPTRV
jgi:hypothetical protein